MCDWAATMLVQVFVDTRVTEHITRRRQCCRIGADFLTQRTLCWVRRKLSSMLGRLWEENKVVSFQFNHRKLKFYTDQ